MTDAADLDWSYFFQIWDPNHHSGERITENLDQILHANTAKTLRPAASPWVLLVCRFERKNLLMLPDFVVQIADSVD